MTERTGTLGKSGAEMEAAVVDLQTRLSYQEDEILHLNRVQESQRAELESLKAEVSRLKELIAASAPAQAGPAGDERPPHY